MKATLPALGRNRDWAGTPKKASRTESVPPPIPTYDVAHTPLLPHAPPTAAAALGCANDWDGRAGGGNDGGGAAAAAPEPRGADSGRGGGGGGGGGGVAAAAAPVAGGAKDTTYRDGGSGTHGLQTHRWLRGQGRGGDAAEQEAASGAGRSLYEPGGHTMTAMGLDRAAGHRPVGSTRPTDATGRDPREQPSGRRRKKHARHAAQIWGVQVRGEDEEHKAH